ncbi:MAG: DNA-directed RNA polymerase subunit D, partial [Candidatus Aenigmatarchaeota archaeon]
MVKILKKDGTGLSFSVEGITPGFANALRRIMIGEIPTMAIEWV